MKTKRWLFLLIGLSIFLFSGIWAFKKFNFNSSHTIGQPLDSINGICVYYNGGVNNVTDRNLTEDNYNLGLKYQCVEFVKRYYYEHFNHKMPDSYGHAKDFFDDKLSDGQKNEKRDLTQYTNSSTSKPKVDDLLIYSGTIFNRFGHVAIVSNVADNSIEIIQQNPGPFSKSREVFSLIEKEGKWTIANNRILGWLRKE
ncbi:CHAP domain-containing protein [Flavobacterium sp. LS1R49]|uniref:CHAP domain-containing protein n=1 Tax=Flavobacterium shii TaxID=2987687 RepID=A0A9X3C4P9_9FLAO|nr:CHAP domain-containing protein [Flavobacterium shii]MCV9928469.1 CHAP domain-containing protein [Flavobacterium shii]